ncbi:exonuclease [Diplocarpon rosae]|nr:exonuclease [Diplocarpon rosae]
MFTPKGLFSEVACPFQETCMLPRCIFNHIEAKPKTVAAEVSVTSSHSGQLNAENNQERPRKRQKPNDETVKPLQVAEADKKTSPNPVLRSKVGERPPSTSRAATRDISPPPLKRKSENVKSTTSKSLLQKPSTPKAGVKAPVVKPPLKQESLNPRVLKYPAPAGHDMRYRLLKALHTEFARLNSELAKDAKDEEEELVLSDQAVIRRALDLEEDAAASAAERSKQAALLPASKPAEPPKPIETGLTIKEELTLLPRLYTPISGLAQHGYVTSIPTAQEISTAKAGIEAAQGWENCDRCKSRFQVFPERRESDGALTSGGPCSYHFGKPYWRERSAADPKAKREKLFRCCGESVGESTGCTQSENHVFKISEVKRLAAISNFEKTPENPEAASDHPVCIDGEMGYTVYGLELIRLTATSWPSGDPIFDVLVRPIGPLLDLNSRYSGVWPKDMANALPWSPEAPKPSSPTSSAGKPPLRILPSPASARALLLSFLTPSTPLIGHGLENDLNVLRLVHPTIIDTALLFPHKAGLPFRNGLKMLMATHLNRQIQVVVDGKMEGHDSKEDANAAGELVRFALANEWRKMVADGWRVKDGAFQSPQSGEGIEDVVVGIPAGVQGVATRGLEREPVRILTNGGAGRKREREELENGEVE